MAVALREQPFSFRHKELYHKVCELSSAFLKFIYVNQMTEILTELRRIESGANVDDELLATIKTVAETYNGLEEKKKS